MSDIIKTDSAYLHGEDLIKDGKPAEFTLTIKSVAERDSAVSKADGKTIRGFPVSFEETPKQLVLNGTNTKLAIAALGSNSRSEWVGKRLSIYPSVLSECFGQSDVMCVRVRVPKGRPKPFVMTKHLGRDLTK